MVYNEKQHNQTHGMVRATECLSNTMYRSRMEASTFPPFLKIIVQIPHYPSKNAVQMLHTRVHSGDQMPPPRGHFTGT